MARRTQRRPSTTNASDLHRQWLELVDTDGPFLAIAPLKRVWPQGMPSLNENRKDALRRYASEPALVPVRLDISRMTGSGYALRLRFSARIAAAVVRERSRQPLVSTSFANLTIDESLEAIPTANPID